MKKMRKAAQIFIIVALAGFLCVTTISCSQGATVEVEMERV